jgi:hypothetical protein
MQHRIIDNSSKVINWARVDALCNTAIKSGVKVLVVIAVWWGVCTVLANTFGGV